MLAGNGIRFGGCETRTKVAAARFRADAGVLCSERNRRPGDGILGLIEDPNPTVRTRKHEVVSCSVAAGSNTYSLWKSASPKKPSGCEKKPKSYRPAQPAKACYERRGKTRWW